MKEAGLILSGVNYMLAVKKCAECSGNSFKVLVDTNIVSLVCEHCGQFYATSILKRLPDDNEATRQIKISIRPTSKDLISV